MDNISKNIDTSKGGAALYEAVNLACWRGGRMVFEKLSFQIEAGDFLHLSGQNGSGKSTLLRLLAGLLQAKEGSVFFKGEHMLEADVAASLSVIYSGHQAGLKPVLTLRENADLFVKTMTGNTLGYETLLEAAAQLDLVDLLDTPVRYFSSGQTHRSALLRFCLLDRVIWLMDEPTVGLDTENRDRLTTIMKKHLDAGGIIIAASHDPIDISGKTLKMIDYSPQHTTQSYWL